MPESKLKLVVIIKEVVQSVAVGVTKCLLRSLYVSSEQILLSLLTQC